MCDSMKKSLKKKIQKQSSIWRICDDFCKRFDQFESVKCKNHDHNDFSSFSMWTQTTMQKSSQKTKNNISCSNELQIKKNKEFDRFLTTKN